MILLSGAAIIPSSIVGYVVGGYVIKRLQLTRTHLLRAMVILSLVSTATMLMFAIQCETAPLADVTVQQHVRYTDT